MPLSTFIIEKNLAYKFKLVNLGPGLLRKGLASVQKLRSQSKTPALKSSFIPVISAIYFLLFSSY